METTSARLEQVNEPRIEFHSLKNELSQFLSVTFVFMVEFGIRA